MRIIKVIMVVGMALFLTFAVLGNVTMSDIGFGAMKTAVGMETTFKHPGAMWRAITTPALLWTIFAGIVLFEALGAVLCWIGAARMWTARRDANGFEGAKSLAIMGLGITAAFYFVGWLVFAGEWFCMWQSQQLNVLPDAFRTFAAAMLIMIWVAGRDE